MDPGITAFASAFEAPFKKAFLDTLKASGVATAKRVASGRHLVKAAGLHMAAPKAKVDFVFDHTNTHVVDYVQEHALETIDDISTATRNKVKDIIARAFDEQKDLSDYADELVDAVGDETRADLIARTESMTAANEGQSRRAS